MDSRFRLVAIFLILDVSFVCTTGDTNLGINATNGEGFLNQSGTHAPQSVKSWSPVYTYPITYTPDFVFPTEDPTEVEPSTSGRLQSWSPVYTYSITYTPDFVFPTEDPTEIEPSTSGRLQELPSINTSLIKMKSEQKCDEYAREIENKTGIKCTIDRPSVSFEKKNDTKYVYYGIILGVETKVDEFPHMVALGKHNSDKIFTLMCGGTLISHTWVLSAAHCTHGPNGSPSHVRLGFHKLTDQNAGVIVGIKKMIRHPEYKPPMMYADIALIELGDAVTFSALIRPACLFQQHYSTPTRAWINGWGVTEFAGEHSDPLLKAEVDLIDNLECTNVYSNVREVPHGIAESMLCAGDSHGNWSRDTCQGDSGGPLQNPDSEYRCLFQIIGITSLGLGCAIINTPGVYSKVSYYVPWIENIVWPEE
nr:PREDICTED: cationic trypsin-like isoform X1 [Linepithema humile]